MQVKSSKVECVCRYCECHFFIDPSGIRRGRGKYCSNACFQSQRAILNQNCFWDKVKKSEGDGCWIWTGHLGKSGHGHYPFRKNGKPSGTTAHKYAWEDLIGPVPNGLCVCHNCPGGDNKACVRPSHMFLGTLGENNKDAARKGTVKRGEDHHCKKLTEEKVKEIRRLYSMGGITHEKLAQMFNVQRTMISGIIQRKRWMWVE
jgi:hypothetical protein